MTRSAAIVALLTLTACTYAPPHAPPAPAAPHAPTPQSTAVHSAVTANRDAARILAAVRNRGLALAPSDVSEVDQLAGAPGYAWSVGRDWLHLHAYPDRAAAAAGARKFIDQMVIRSQIIDWAGKPHLFQCGTVVALYLGEAPQALNVITSLCGPPVWRR